MNMYFGYDTMKKIFICVIALMLAAASVCFTSCGEKLSEDEALATAEALIKASLPLNEIYYGEGLPYDKEADDKAVMYAPVTDGAAYITETELREATLEVFTEQYASSVFAMFLTGYSDDETGGVIYARYVDNGERLTVNLSAEPLVEKARSYDFSTAKIVKLKAKEIVIEYETLVDGEKDIAVEVTLKLDKRDGGDVWRIDSPTY